MTAADLLPRLRRVVSALETGGPLDAADAAWIAPLVADAEIPRPAGGRPEIDDAGHLAEIEWLLANGKARSVLKACEMVARSIRGANIEATTERLRRKYRDRCRIVGQN